MSLLLQSLNRVVVVVVLLLLIVFCDGFCCCFQVVGAHSASRIGVVSDMAYQSSQHRCSVAMGDVSCVRGLVCLLVDSGSVSEAVSHQPEHRSSSAQGEV